jgi:hypothetical protein
VEMRKMTGRNRNGLGGRGNVCVNFCFLAGKAFT